MSSYIGRYAELYNVVYAEKPYRQEAMVLHNKLQKFSTGKVERILELACGTGRHAFELEKFGYQILATDYSEDLLAIARTDSSLRRSKVEFRFQDMRELNIPESPFDAVYCLFDSIGYVQSNKGLKQAMDGVYRNLSSGGLFVFEFWHAAAMLCKYEPRRERYWKTNQGDLKRISSTHLDIPLQLAYVTYDFEEKSPEGLITTFSETQLNRFFLMQEMALFLQNSGFDALEWSPAYQDNEVITQETWHILCVARRR